MTAKKKPVELITTENKLLKGKPKWAYTLQDKSFGEFKVLRSANAWWMDSVKLELLVNAFKYRATNIQAMIAAGISQEQMTYFLQKHPDFYSIIERCRQVPGLKAKQSVVQALDRDLPTARWFLERTEPGEFGPRMPTVAVQINMGDAVGKDRDEFSK